MRGGDGGEVDVRAAGCERGRAGGCDRTSDGRAKHPVLSCARQGQEVEVPTSFPRNTLNSDGVLTQLCWALHSLRRQFDLLFLLCMR